jgi:hypothetical protein
MIKDKKFTIGDYTNMKYEYRQINSKFIVSDTDYQRLLKTERVKKILNEFNPMKVNPPKLSLRDGKHYVWDGQTTTTVLKHMNGGNDLMINCLVYCGLSKEDEGWLFVTQDNGKTKVSGNDKIKASYTLKLNESDVQMVDIARSLGLVIDFSGSNGVNKIICLATLKYIFLHTDTETYKNILTVAKESWFGQPDSFIGEILKGLYIVFSVYKDEINVSTMIKQLRNKTTPNAIQARGNNNLSLKGFSRYAIEIIEVYNHNLVTKNKLDKTLLFAKENG